MKSSCSAASNNSLLSPERTQRDTGVLLAKLADHLEGAAATVRELAAGFDSDLAVSEPQSVSAHVTVGPAATETREYLSQVDLAEMLGAHPRTVRRMELSGELPDAIEIGRLKRWRRSEIQDWIENGRPKRKARTR